MLFWLITVSALEYAVQSFDLDVQQARYVGDGAVFSSEFSSAIASGPADSRSLVRLRHFAEPGYHRACNLPPPAEEAMAIPPAPLTSKDSSAALPM
jgi:hypothetical protein